MMSSEEQARLIKNVVDSLKNVPEFIQKRMVTHCYKADPAYGEGVDN